MNPGFPPKPGGPWRDPRYAGGAWLDWKRKQEERERRAQQAAQRAAPPGRGQPADPFSQVEAEAARLRQEWAAGRLTDEQLTKRLAELMLQDAQGAWWAVGMQTGEWYRYNGREWVRAKPPRLATTAAAPTGGPAGALSLPVSPSGVVYLHAHHFVGKAPITSTRIAVPCQSVKVNVWKRRDAVVAAAFIALATGGYARLYLGARRGRLGAGRHKAVLVEPLVTGAGTSGLEGRMLACVANGPAPKTAVDIVKDLRKPGILGPVHDELRAQGYYRERGKLAQLFREKWVPDCERILALQAHVQSVKGMIETFKQSNSAVHDQLGRDIRAALR